MSDNNFSASVDAFCDKATREIEAHCRSVALTLIGLIIERTPVLRGRLRGDWRVNVGSPNYDIRPASVEMSEAYDSRSEAEWASIAADLKRKALEEASAAIARWDVSQPLFINNNLPYAYRIEYEGYSKTKAPEGMVRVSILQVEQGLRKVAA